MKFWTLSLLLIVSASGYASSVEIVTKSLPNAVANTAYSAIINARGGCTPFSWEIVSGTLPTGVTATVSSTTMSLILSGTPTTVATDSFTVQVTGCGGHVSQVSYQVAVHAVPSYVRIVTSGLPNGTVDAAYSAVINAAGGCTPYQWALASGALPAGVTASVSSTTRSLNLSGTPTTPANNSLSIKVTGCGGHVSQVSYNVAIQPTANDFVALNWNASTTSDVVGYNVYRAPDGVTWKRINASVVASTLYNDLTVSNGSTYYYATTAVSASGQESSKSAIIQVAIP